MTLAWNDEGEARPRWVVGTVFAVCPKMLQAGSDDWFGEAASQQPPPLERPLWAALACQSHPHRASAMLRPYQAGQQP